MSFWNLIRRPFLDARSEVLGILAGGSALSPMEIVDKGKGRISDSGVYDVLFELRDVAHHIESIIVDKDGMPSYVWRILPAGRDWLQRKKQGAAV